MLHDKEGDHSRVYHAADAVLLAGGFPDASHLAIELDLAPEVVATALQQWRQVLPERVRLDQRGSTLPDIPEALSQAFTRIWQHAVQEAQSNVTLNRQQLDVGAEEARRINEEALRQSQGIYHELEARYREQGVKLDESRQHSKSLEAELAVLKNNLAGETTTRKREEQLRANSEHELAQIRKQFEDYRRTTDQRIKDEQRKSVDSSAKAEVEVRHYRGMLDKIRDEAGKKEAALLREVHELQAQLARRDVKIDTQTSQIKSLEEEIGTIKQDVGVQHRDLTKTSSELLSETNKNKRLEGKIKEQEEEIRRLNQRSMTASADSTRRDNALRAQLKERDDELMKAQARINALEKRLVSQDEEIRRLSARL